MEYMIINHSAESTPPEYGTPEAEAFMGRWMAYNQLLIDGGHWVAGASLSSTDVATTVRKVDGALEVRPVGFRPDA